MTASRFQTIAGLLVSLAGLAGTAVGRETIATVPQPPVSALEFRVNGNFELDALIGTSISWKRYSGGNRGWRLGLSPEFSRASGSLGNYEEHGQKHLALAVERQRLGFMDSRSLARPYWGPGLVIGARRTEGFSRRELIDESTRRFETVGNEYRGGFVGTLGAEFTIADRIVIGAEYTFTAIWSWVRRIEQQWNLPPGTYYHGRMTSRAFGLGPRPVALTLAILILSHRFRLPARVRLG